MFVEVYHGRLLTSEKRLDAYQYGKGYKTSSKSLECDGRNSRSFLPFLGISKACNSLRGLRGN